MTVLHAPDLVEQDLVDLTRRLGEPARDLVILAEGNTSRTLPDGRVVVKASGSNMQTVTADDFVVVDVEPLIELAASAESTQRELTDALDAGEVDGKRRRASIEALVHVVMHALKPAGSPELYVGHTHPTDVVGLLASVHAATAYDDWVYSDEAVVIGRPLYVPYASPGIDLGRVYYQAVKQRVDETGELPALVLLGNHGIVATAPTAGGVEGISAMAVKGARVRVAAYSVGGVAPLPRASVEKFFARDDIAERRGNLAGNRF
jgi:rhamnose utilization protein RhaD (predicted bifunctional aldolase and dehydrogenase)